MKKCDFKDYATGEECQADATDGLLGVTRCFDCAMPLCDDHIVTCSACDQGVCPHCYDRDHEDNCAEADIGVRYYEEDE